MERGAKRSRLDINFVHQKDFVENIHPKNYDKELQDIKKSLKRLENSSKKFIDKYDKILKNQEEMLEMCKTILLNMEIKVDSNSSSQEMSQINLENLTLEDDCSYIS